MFRYYFDTRLQDRPNADLNKQYNIYIQGNQAYINKKYISTSTPDKLEFFQI